MSLIKLNKSNQSFGLLFAIFFIICGLVFTLLLPDIIKTRDNFLNNQIEKARRASDNQNYDEAIALLKLAEKLSFGNRAPSFELVNVYEVAGQSDLMIRTLQGLPFAQSYSQLGSAALTYQNYDAAASTYSKAVRQFPSDETFAGLATAQFNLGKIEDGCSNAEQANKENLDSAKAKAVHVACLLLEDRVEEAKTLGAISSSSLTTSPRSIAYGLIKLGIVKIGEKRLDELNNKSVQDWLILAQIAASRGDIKLAITRAEEGYKQQPTNIELNQLLLKLNLKIENNNSANIYRTHLENLGTI